MSIRGKNIFQPFRSIFVVIREIQMFFRLDHVEDVSALLINDNSNRNFKDITIISNDTKEKTNSDGVNKTVQQFETLLYLKLFRFRLYSQLN